MSVGGWGLSHQTNAPLLSQTNLHAELLGLLSQHGRCRDQRQLITLAWMEGGWGSASWQRRAQR